MHALGFQGDDNRGFAVRRRLPDRLRLEEDQGSPNWIVQNSNRHIRVRNTSLFSGLSCFRNLMPSIRRRVVAKTPVQVSFLSLFGSGEGKLTDGVLYHFLAGSAARTGGPRRGLVSSSVADVITVSSEENIVCRFEFLAVELVASIKVSASSAIEAKPGSTTVLSCRWV